MRISLSLTPPCADVTPPGNSYIYAAVQEDGHGSCLSKGSATGGPSMPDPIDQELLELEKQYWEAICNRDGATATRLSDARCMVIGPQGIGKLDREALAGMVENASHELKRYRLDEDVHVRTIADGVALIAYKVNEEIVVDGQTRMIEA